MNSNLKIFALGGLNEVGKNCYVFEKGKEIIIIDCGIKFANNIDLADGIIPNFSYLQKNREKIKGLFITHGHEDHIGAIPYLLEIIPEIPIYGSEFSINLIKQKINSNKEIRTSIFDKNTNILIGEFRISFFTVSHSIPGSFGIIIEVLTYNITIAVTGDFKLDLTEIGGKTDLIKLVDLGKKGINLLLSDSTNAGKIGNTPSEKIVIRNLKDVIKKAKRKVIITSFASNVDRLGKIIKFNEEIGRKVVFLGSSLERIIRVIAKTGLWNKKMDNSLFLKPSLISKIPSNKLTAFCAGSQGETNSAMYRLANQTYPNLKIEKDDYVILTSSPIMDNLSNVRELNNKIDNLGAKIYENDENNLLHSSGHACQEDLKLMIKLLNPENFMPFHGDFRMLKQHSILAKKMGIAKEKIFVCKNGEVIEYNGKNFFLSNEIIDANPEYIFEGKKISLEKIEEDIHRREIMSKSGIILILLIYKNKKIGNVYIFTYGLFNMKKNENLINWWRIKIQSYLKENEIYLEKIKTVLEKYMKEEIMKKWEKEKPLIHIITQEK